MWGYWDWGGLLHGQDQKEYARVQATVQDLLATP